MPKVKQPLLIVQGDLDRNVPPSEADRLAELARARKKARRPKSVARPRCRSETGEPTRSPQPITEWIKKLRAAELRAENWQPETALDCRP